MHLLFRNMNTTEIIFFLNWIYREYISCIAECLLPVTFKNVIRNNWFRFPYFLLYWLAILNLGIHYAAVLIGSFFFLSKNHFDFFWPEVSYIMIKFMQCFTSQHVHYLDLFADIAKSHAADFISNQCFNWMTEFEAKLYTL